MNVALALQYFSLTSGHSGWAFDSLLSISSGHSEWAFDSLLGFLTLQ